MQPHHFQLWHRLRLGRLRALHNCCTVQWDCALRTTPELQPTACWWEITPAEASTWSAFIHLLELFHSKLIPLQHVCLHEDKEDKNQLVGQNHYRTHKRVKDYAEVFKKLSHIQCRTPFPSADFCRINQWAAIPYFTQLFRSQLLECQWKLGRHIKIAHWDKSAADAIRNSPQVSRGRVIYMLVSNSGWLSTEMLCWERAISHLILSIINH